MADKNIERAVQYLQEAGFERIDENDRVLLKRINRALAKEYGMFGSPPVAWMQLKKARGSHSIRNLGQYYLLNVYTNTIAETHVDIKDKASELGVDCWKPKDSVQSK